MTAPAPPLPDRLPLLRAAAAAGGFFLLLCSYYILRPVRDEMAVQSGMGSLPWLFTATLGLTLLAVPFFGWLARVAPRRHLLPLVYGFLVANLLAFYAAFRGGPSFAAAASFFVWLSFFNLFAVSLFWSRLADAFSKEESHRLYGYIAAGGTAGALAGPGLTALLAKALGTANLLLLSCALLALAGACLVLAGRGVQRDPTIAEPLGGSVLAGVPLALKVKSLRAIVVLVLCYTVVSTFLYLEVVAYAGQAYSDPGERTAFFARLDLAVNGLAMAVQLLGLRRMVERFGLRGTLAIVPLVMTAGLAAFAAFRTLIMAAALQTLHRAGEFALAKPGREMVYTVVDAESRYKAKNFIDTVVHRAGDAGSAWAIAGLKAASLDPLLVAALPAALGWLAANYYVGKRHDRDEPA